MFELVEQIIKGAKIKVVGVGGAGGNAVNTMIRSHLEGVEFMAVNTDMQALTANAAQIKVQIGTELTRGLGAGANPEIGKNAALEDHQSLLEVLSDSDMVFITAGMGGGTGTGAAPVIAKLAKEAGALTVGVVTKPFGFEGRRRSRVAEEGISELRQSVDTLITIPNEKLITIAGRDTTVIDAFKKADEVLVHAVRGISDLITIHGLINLDFADVKTIMSEMGMALMGSGVSSGENRAVDAATRAISSPLLENISIRGATGILINITGGPNLTLHEVNEASKMIQEEADEDANIIFGSVIDESMGDDVRVTVIATGFNKSSRSAKVAARPAIVQRTPVMVENRWTPPARKPAPAMAPHVEQPQLATQSASYGSDMETRRGSAVSFIDDTAPSWRSGGSAKVEEADMKEFVDSVGALDYQNDEYDIPTFLRKQAD